MIFDHLAPPLGHGVKDLHGVQPLLPVVAADGVEPVLHHGHPHLMIMMVMMMMMMMIMMVMIMMMIYI